MVFRFSDCENLKAIKSEGMERGVGDVEEGEISDSSIEEITEEVFKNKEAAKLNSSNSSSNNNKQKGSDPNVWTVHDLYSKYPTICRGYGLVNLAWATAVQNRSLNEIFVMDVDPDSNANANASAAMSSNQSSSGSAGVKENASEVVIVDDDKEEGELEEGEIDDDGADPEASVTEGVQSAAECGVVASDTDSTSDKLSVREVLEGVTVANVEESFEGTCSRLQKTLQRLPDVLSGLEVSERDDLVLLAFKAVELVYSVFSFKDSSRREQCKDTILRLLSLVKDQLAQLFSPDNMKEIQVMISAVDSIGALDNIKACANETQLVIKEIMTKEISAVKAGEFVSSSKHLNTNSIGSLEVLKYGQSNIKGRGILLPLLDLHKDHDIDSLPSPTREAPSCIPVSKAFSVQEGTVGSRLPASKIESGKMEAETEDSKFHHYETDALKAVSTYQQKFGRSSFFTYDKLPSPTPSGDGGNMDIDATEEVSSAPKGASLRSNKPTISEQPPVSSSSIDGSSVHGLITSRTDAPVSGSYPMKTSAKSRDPRLRFINSNSSATEQAGMMMSRKQKASEDPTLDVAIAKRLKSSLENTELNTREIRTTTGNGGWLEENNVIGSQLIERNHLKENADFEPRNTMTVSSSLPVSGNFNVTNNGKEQAPVTSNINPAFPALLKDIAVNPTMLLNILMEQQQRLAAEAKKPSDPAMGTAHLPIQNLAMGSNTTVSIGPSMTAGIQQKSTGPLPVSSQATSTTQILQDDPGKIRMKPRDPRRILHGNSLQKSGSMGSEQFKSVISPALNNQGTGDNVNALKPEVRAETELAPPDIARQFTKNLKNIADIVSVKQESSSISSASVPLKSDRAEPMAVVSTAQNLSTGNASATSKSPGTWGDVAHLFEGYDEKQKAAIQRERARRIEEQNKMFAARKLCLVLDLDHTLLNSAKFVEVDPVHDAILRKKEEQDREKTQRQLFRFPHMGMWTKLRPGIWNFLEKASKLYELHLYTMGNKLYPTEMAKILDPKGVLFKGRVISRGDDADSVDGDERVPKSKDLEGVLGMESAVVIIDDSVRVWPHNKLNLIVVERYTYFPCSRRQFGLPGPSLLEIDHDERPEAGTLASSLAVIEKIHQIFFSSPSLHEVDVRNILATEQRKILAGCRIVFSRVFPREEANPHLHPLWQTAEQFGAVCTNKLDHQVTHVVANSPGTDKQVAWAASQGKFIVHPGWVEASALLYRRANEQDFAIKL
ncbi:RNA polymerase II C-terminal domain phosphatase-like [Arachis hypogaea]|uniref:protein-serine/threonine phosphatase n=1 Tax=Arachis hypogaea TaxID=3818 RepID=A0A445DAL2_ARAHY|nr:RNA polymerase II C-terminal domain phosphatase-like [Arachis hypogaea]RYR60199.1 hypothetical protein Ahy_A04g017266 [Arachis hypogaea]